MNYWHSKAFNQFYNPWMRFMYGRKNLVRGMDRNELKRLVETKTLESKAMRSNNPDKMGVYGVEGQKQHLEKSYDPQSQYISTIDLSQFEQEGNHFGDFQVEMEAPNRAYSVDSIEKQELVEGGTSVDIRKIHVNGKSYNLDQIKAL